MGIRFTATAWRDWVDQFTRTGKQLHLASTLGGEFAGGGYKPIGLAGAQWTITERGQLLVASYPEVKWVFAGQAPGAVAGYYVTNAKGEPIWLEDFDDAEPFEAKRAGDWLAVAMVIDLDLVED